MPITLDLDLAMEDRAQLATILGVGEEALDETLARVATAATVEYLEQFLGRKVFTRGSDIREYRLLCLIRHLYCNRLPSEGEVSALYQTTTTQSRALIRAVASKYQYELGDIQKATLKEAVERISRIRDSNDWQLNEPSDYIIEALNRVLGRLDGTLTRLIRKEGTVSNYVVKPATRDKLREHFGVAG